MGTSLLTLEEVAAMLRKSTRTVRRRPIPFIRDGNSRLYEMRDVQDYMRENKECLQANGRARRTTGRTSKSMVGGFSEALRQHPSVKPTP